MEARSEKREKKKREKKKEKAKEKTKKKAKVETHERLVGGAEGGAAEPESPATQLVSQPKDAGPKSAASGGGGRWVHVYT